jgi:hypothetical protein
MAAGLAGTPEVTLFFSLLPGLSSVNRLMIRSGNVVLVFMNGLQPERR